MNDQRSYRTESPRHRRLGRAAAVAILSEEQHREDEKSSNADSEVCGPAMKTLQPARKQTKRPINQNHVRGMGVTNMIALTAHRLTPYTPHTSEEAVCTRATAILSNSPYLSLRSVKCNYEGGNVTLRGEVPTFYLKQLAQSLVGGMVRPENILNLVQVKPPGTRLRHG